MGPLGLGYGDYGVPCFGSRCFRQREGHAHGWDDRSRDEMVLLAILQAGADANGYAVRRTLERDADRSVSKGAFYTTLDRLEAKGYLTWEVREPRSERSDLPQRHFTVTPAGLDELRRSRKALLKLWSGLEGVLDG